MDNLKAKAITPKGHTITRNPLTGDRALRAIQWDKRQASGESYRHIAQTDGVPLATVQRDIMASRAGMTYPTHKSIEQSELIQSQAQAMASMLTKESSLLAIAKQSANLGHSMTSQAKTQEGEGSTSLGLQGQTGTGEGDDGWDQAGGGEDPPTFTTPFLPDDGGHEGGKEGGMKKNSGVNLDSFDTGGKFDGIRADRAKPVEILGDSVDVAARVVSEALEVRKQEESTGMEWYERLKADEALLSEVIQDARDRGDMKTLVTALNTHAALVQQVLKSYTQLQIHMNQRDPTSHPEVQAMVGVIKEVLRDYPEALLDVTAAIRRLVG